MDDLRSDRGQANDGLKTVTSWLLGFVWLVLVFAGLAVAFSESKYPPVVGWLCLGVAAVALVFTAERWIKTLPALMSLATLNSVIMAFSGHSTGNRTVQVSKATAISLTLLFGIGTILSQELTSRKLGLTERLAILVLAVSLAWGAVSPRSSVIALGVGIAFLSLAWLQPRILKAR